MPGSSSPCCSDSSRPRRPGQPSAVNAGPPPPTALNLGGSRASAQSHPRPFSRVASPLDLEADAAAAAAMEDAIDGVHESTTHLLDFDTPPPDLRVLALPFELRVVEAALFHVCARLLDETMALVGRRAGAGFARETRQPPSRWSGVRRVKGRDEPAVERRRPQSERS